MIITARQLEDLHRNNGSGNGQLVLPYGARLSPLAADWIRSRKINVDYGPNEIAKPNAAKPTPVRQANQAKPPAAPYGAFLYWCDGPCGAAKAAVGALAKETSLAEIASPAEPTQLVPVIKRLATDVKSNKAAGAILLLQSGAAAVVLANRCPSLRAILGTTFESLEAGINSVAANVLVLEYPRKGFSEIRNLISRFVRARRDPSGPSDHVQRQLQELTTCG